MVIRELKDGRCFVSLQEDHAELSAQFAAHWGNDRFSRLRPYQTMVFATTYHDSGYREWEGTPPMNVEKGRPYAHREDVPRKASKRSVSVQLGAALGQDAAADARART